MHIIIIFVAFSNYLNFHIRLQFLEAINKQNMKRIAWTPNRPQQIYNVQNYLFSNYKPSAEYSSPIYHTEMTSLHAIEQKQKKKQKK